MEKLSPAELQVVKLIGCQGMTTEAAAKVLKRTHRSVRNLAQQILEKTDSKRLCQAVYRLTVAGALSGADGDAPEYDGTETEHRLHCTNCGKVTRITHGEQVELLKQMDPKYPGRAVTVECPCGREQFALYARVV